VSLIPRQSLRRHLTVAGLAAAFALIQSHIISLEFKLSGYTASTNVAFGVVTGHPSWREFQSRVLAPYIVLGISRITHNFLSAHFAFGIVAMTVGGYLSWQLGLRGGGDLKSAVISFLALQFGFCYLFSPPWLYAWDYLGVLIFLVFILMIVDQKSWVWFTGLFIIAILNRESGEFIALWMVLDPFAKALFSGKRAGEQRIMYWRMAIAGFCCLISGVVIVEFLRVHLMIQEMGVPGIVGHRTGFVFLQMRTNFGEIARALRHIRNGFEAPMLLFPLAVAYYAVRLAIRNPRQWLGLSLVSLANLGAIFVVGIVLESRVYLELLPFVIVGLLMSVTERGAEQSHEVAPGGPQRATGAIAESSGR
jgi:hypothetical protein